MTSKLHLHQLADHAATHDRDADTPLHEAVLLVPSASISCISLEDVDIPKRYIEQALPSLLEDRLAEDSAELQLSYLCPRGSKQLIVLAARKQQLQEWLDATSASGVEPSAIYPDFYQLPFVESQVSLRIDADYAVVRLDKHQGFSGQLDEVLALLTRLKDADIHLYGEAADQLPNELSITNHPTEDVSLLGAIDLRQGEFAQKRAVQNPYKAFMWPMGLAAAALIALCIQWYSAASFYQQQNTSLTAAVEQSYQQVFGSRPDGDWLAGSKYQAALANQQLIGTKLTEWRLLASLNELINQCRDCVVEEITINKQGALITLLAAGSENLISDITNSSLLVLNSQQQMETNVTLTVALRGA